MSADSPRIRLQTMSGRGKLLRWLILLLILSLSGFVLSFNYMASNVIFFGLMLIFILLAFNKAQARNLLLFIYAHFLVAISIINVAIVYPPVRRWATENLAVEGFLPATEATVLTAIILGVTGAFLLVTIPFFLIVATTALTIWRWYKEEEISFIEVFLHVTRTILGIDHFVLFIKDEDTKGDETDKRRLKIFGGPGWLIIHPGQVVILHRHGRITRTVSSGSIMLTREENIKGIVPFGSKAKPQTIKNVLTRDRIPLELEVFHVAQMESATETKTRLKQALEEAKTHLKEVEQDQESSDKDKQSAKQKFEEAEKQLKDLDKDKIIVDGDNQCYESIAKKVSPDVWKALAGPVASIMRDVIMSEYSEELFDIHDDTGDLAARINQRKIATIEKIVLEKAKQIKLKSGIVLKAVDISEVCFPEDIKEKINDEAKKLIEERIERTEARIEESKAKAAVIKARAEAQTKILEGQSEGESRAAEIREIVRELRREKLPQDQIMDAILKLLNTKSSVKELESFLKSTGIARQIQSQYAPGETNGSHKK